MFDTNSRKRYIVNCKRYPIGGHVELAGQASGVGARGAPLGGGTLAPPGARGGPRPCKPLTHNEEYYEVNSKTSFNHFVDE